jgi:Domain of unknown function (DUF4287)
MVKADYWNVSDAEVIEKTGHPIEHWTKILDEFNASSKPSKEAVTYLQVTHNVPRYWARTLVTHIDNVQKGEL